MSTDLNKLYSARRTGPQYATQSSTSDNRTAFQRDYDRIIFSSAFRRLQNKTQVFPLPGSVFVHNRLTHSLEVSSVGRSLGTLAGEFIANKFASELTSESQEFYRYSLNYVISAACLCHDIGNPAFGHSGEDAIASFFQENKSQLEHFFSEKEWADLVHFEGNANAIRVLTQQQNGKSGGGLMLTFSTLSAIAKYPCEAIASTKGILHRKKFGFFQSEKKVFQQIANHTTMQEESGEPLIYKRHPFVWLVEAADDICYNIVDMEDAHRLHIIDHRDCLEIFLSLVKDLDPESLGRTKHKIDAIADRNDKISYLRAKSISVLVKRIIEIYQEKFAFILGGSQSKALFNTIESQALKDIGAFSQKYIYNNAAVVEIENAGYNVLSELLRHFVIPILKTERNNAEKKALSLLPEQFQYQNGTPYEKTLGVLDYISGMTDNYATELYRKIKGIEIGKIR
ncbi:MAG: deoxyguanosinetriphosphate triphosphohydrolase [Pseudopedobacter saltans]|uniref:Deoxyguanosinetriphosphate triphosphohydrolase n=1 Tax=Pseudopedobacter saltans TaxID=151895 RepID=A0A2W5F663_9SPHI|nr:MAG: deoxyguanosinetriphosphate triphosphohydrolase [Pseudopedobacter saltans]